MIRIKNLSLLRGTAVVLAGFFAALAAGQGVWLTGANGSGKTSLLRACAGLLPPLAGAVECDAEKIFIGTAAGHDTALTCEENLGFWCAMNVPSPNPLPMGEGRPVGALKEAGLWKLRNQPAATLSAGQSQRLALARLLCSDAKLWLLDEPFTALDADGRAWLCGMMQNHLQRGGAIICATHQTYDVTGMERWQL